MAERSILVENIGKRFRLGQRDPGTALREALEDALRAPVGRVAALFHPPFVNDDGRRMTSQDHLWALRQVSFEIRRGDVMGLIGPNGAGKSVLLKILSRITKPTEGRAELHGRVGSMLEGGTGFHPELTGRENIYLSGTLLGMKRSQIDLAFDEMVAVSGLEKFLSTPVKRYSSGMRVRLAFAIAAHLEPDILLLDEVLAAGDEAFQQQGQEKLQQMTSEGRTILFVSHNMKTIQDLCQRVVLLSAGRVIRDGAPQDVIPHYVALAGSPGGEVAQPQEAFK